HAEKMAAQFGLECAIMGPEEIRALKMGAFWAVAQGSEEPPKLIVLRYDHPADVDSPWVGLVGKGITFDTGGISIKPSENMHEMKTDMAGGAPMLGAMRAIAPLTPPARVMAVVPATADVPTRKGVQPGGAITPISCTANPSLHPDRR